MPPPGWRLDDLEAYHARCLARTRKAAAATKTAEDALAEAKKAAEDTLAEAQKAQAEAETAEREAAAKLEQLRTDLARTDAAMPDAHGSDAAPGAHAGEGAADAELAALRTLLQQAVAARDAACLAAGQAPPEPEEQTREAEATLEGQLKAAQEAFAAALSTGSATAQKAGELAVLTARAEAVRSKRRRVSAETGGSGSSTPRTPR